MAKKCGVCGEMVASHLIECPKCGRGVFESEKMHRDSVDNLISTFSTSEPHTGKKKSSRSWWKRLCGTKEPPTHRGEERSGGPTTSCYTCGKPFSKGNSLIGTTRKLVSKKGSNGFVVKYFCSEVCRNSEVTKQTSLRICSWCGGSVSSSIPGGVGEPYCSSYCYSSAGNIFADMGDQEMNGYL